MNETLLYTAAVLTGLWGVAHLFATSGVVRSFGHLTQDSRRILTMEWIVEGVALIATASYIATVTIIQPTAAIASAVYAVAVVTLVVLAVVSLFTGFKVAFLPFRLCPLVFGNSAALIAFGAWV